MLKIWEAMPIGLWGRELAPDLPQLGSSQMSCRYGMDTQVWPIQTMGDHPPQTKSCKPRKPRKGNVNVYPYVTEANP